MDSVDDILGTLNAQIASIGNAVHQTSNQLAALQAQNSDIANGRWTLNNAAYQFNQLQPIGQLAVMGAIAYLAVKLIKG